MTKKTMKSRNMQNHKKPTDKDLLQEEFGQELGDTNAAKIYETIAEKKEKEQKKDK